MTTFENNTFHETVTVDAKRLADLERDAARYRWLRRQKNEDFEFAVVKNPHFDLYEAPGELDIAIDDAMGDRT